jgi:hypothetical protein
VSERSGTTATLVGEVQRSLRRARLEAERRRLERERRDALALLGARASELAIAGALPAAALTSELARVEQSSTRVEEHDREVAALGPERRLDDPAASAGA